MSWCRSAPAGQEWASGAGSQRPSAVSQRAVSLFTGALLLCAGGGRDRPSWRASICRTHANDGSSGGRQAMGDGRWAMGDGRKEMGDGRWASGDGRCGMDDGRWAIGDVLWAVGAAGDWRWVVAGGWCLMGNGQWAMSDGREGAIEGHWRRDGVSVRECLGTDRID